MKFNLCISNGTVVNSYDDCAEALRDALFATEETNIPHHVVPSGAHQLKGDSK
ncbi:hypothetical protein [Bacillus sp. Marseille-P3800]|uniref:hypothetical protein n=1 Tax=Bacillus sp. Marseille-P3800 TaxID=2014782 RepID=UPI000C06905D|nr:hypothetical protein [Bacillus sp. Marseille-P3800]